MTALPIVLAVLALHWLPQVSSSKAGLRGVSIASQEVAWVSGTKGTVLRTVDAGRHWNPIKVPGAEALDFRDVTAFDQNRALILASGPGDASRVYRTEDGGHVWTLALSNPEKTGFFDAMKFWDRRNGILLGDAVAGRFTIYTTGNGGVTWSRAEGPAALDGEGAFAASGTCLAVLGKQNAWFGSGGIAGARVFRTADGGQSWSASLTPLAGGAASAGIFSVAFRDAQHGLATGGDYRKPAETAHVLASTSDGGKTWVASSGPGGFRSAVSYLKPAKIWIAVGTSGSDYSLDGGATWKTISSDNLNAFAGYGTSSWAVGPAGLIVKLALQP